MTRTLAALVAASGASPSEARAATLDFFTPSFLDPLAPIHEGLVAGVVRGLTDSSVRAARSVEVTGDAEGFGLGEYAGLPLQNFWRVEDGRMPSVAFVALSTPTSSECAPAEQLTPT